jgi:hypothetical protein
MLKLQNFDSVIYWCSNFDVQISPNRTEPTKIQAKLLMFKFSITDATRLFAYLSDSSRVVISILDVKFSVLSDSSRVVQTLATRAQEPCSGRVSL